MQNGSCNDTVETDHLLHMPLGHVITGSHGFAVFSYQTMLTYSVLWSCYGHTQIGLQTRESYGFES